MACQTMLAGMKFSITGTPNSHGVTQSIQGAKMLTGIASYNHVTLKIKQFIIENLGLRGVIINILNNSGWLFSSFES